MPGSVLQSIHNGTDSTLDFASPQYTRAYSVDATPSSGDLLYNNAWHTWLVGGLGEGGNAIYALDITDSTNFSETNASSLVIGEWSAATISCVNASGCGVNLGKTYGTPAIRRFHNGTWGFVFGNGIDSANGHAGVFVGLVNATSGAVSFYWLDTGSGSSSSKNGIAFVTPADLDGDHIVDYLYAGDVKGNVWRFNVRDPDPTKWAVSKFANGSATPLFTTPNSQPIWTRLLVLSTPAKSGSPRVMVIFGTGRETTQTVTSSTSYASGTQSLYGIWDWDMADWSSKSSTAYAYLSGPVSISSSSNLTAQTILDTVASSQSNGIQGYRTLSQNAVCWQGSTSCSSGNTKLGWKLDLPASGEQIIYSPIVANGAVLVNTTIPANNSLLSCQPNLPSGWLMAFTPSEGASFTKSFFGDSSNNFVTINGHVVSGIGLSGTGSPSSVTAQGKVFVVTQTSSGTPLAAPINPPSGGTGGRVTWTELR
jgi:type IV pilus assembly protein PilY1